MSQATADIPGGAERRSGDRRFTTVQVIVAVILTLGLLLTLNFSSRIQLDRELRGIHAGVRAEIEALQREQAALTKQLTYVKSDAYVAYWARDEGKMVRDGEVLILPQGIAAPAETAKSKTPLVDVVTTLPEPENWELWWALFFDNPPPS